MRGGWLSKEWHRRILGYPWCKILIPTIPYQPQISPQVVRTSLKKKRGDHLHILQLSPFLETHHSPLHNLIPTILNIPLTLISILRPITPVTTPPNQPPHTRNPLLPIRAH